MRRSILIYIFSFLIFSPCYAEITATPDSGDAYILVNSVELPVSCEEAFDYMTGDISGWWDHNFSGDPKEFYIEAKPGGSFMEIFDEDGNGVQHAVVNVSNHGKMLRFTGPLGLSGKALTMVHTWKYEEIDDGCKVTCEVHATGEIDDELAKIVDSVWQHFLIGGLKPYVEKQIQASVEQ